MAEKRLELDQIPTGIGGGGGAGASHDIKSIVKTDGDFSSLNPIPATTINFVTSRDGISFFSASCFVSGFVGGPSSASFGINVDGVAYTLTAHNTNNGSGGDFTAAVPQAGSIALQLSAGPHTAFLFGAIVNLGFNASLANPMTLSIIHPGEVAGTAPIFEGALVTHNATQVCPNGGSLTLSFNTVRRNDGGLYNIAFPTRLTAPRDGWYDVGSQVRWGPSTNNGVLHEITLQKNGVTAISDDVRNDFVHVIERSSSTSKCVFLQAGDYVEVIVSCSTTQQNVNAVPEYSPEFWMVLVAPVVAPIGGGGGGGGASAIIRQETGPFSATVNPPNTSYIPIAGSSIAITLDEPKVVVMSAYTHFNDPGSNAVNGQLAIRLTSPGPVVTTFEGNKTRGGNDVNAAASTLTRTVSLAAGVHTFELMARNPVSGGTYEFEDAFLTIFYTEPVFGLAALSKAEAISQAGGTFSVASDTFTVVPNSTINFTLGSTQTVLFEGYGSAQFDGGFVGNAQLGVRVDGTDYPGTALDGGTFGNALNGGISVHRALSLGAGGHTAMLVLRRSVSHPSTAVLHTSTAKPAVLTAIFTEPEEIAPLTGTPATTVNAGDAAGTGTALEAARADHMHAVNTGVLVDIGIQGVGAGTAGTSPKLPRADHVHPMSSATPAPTGTANVEGVATTVSRSDHVHRLQLDVQEEGTSVGARPKLNFIGGAVTAVDNPGQDRVDVTVSAASLTGSAPTTIQPDDAAAVGVATDAARADHKHAIVADPPVDVGTANAEGTATSFSRADHVHKGMISVQDEGSAVGVRGKLNFVGSGITATDDPGNDRVNVSVSAAVLTGSAPTTIQPDDAAAVGVATDAARADHRHAIVADAPVSVDKSANAEGSSTSFSRADHKHDVSTGAPGTILPDDAAAEGTATSLARSDHKHAIAADVPVNVTKAANAEGSSTSFSRADHKHDVSTAAAVDLTDSTNAEGSATTLARSDHTHAHGNRGGGSLHALATTSVAGFMSAADKTKIDGVAAESSETMRFVGMGAITTTTGLDGAWIAPAACTILRITLWRRTAGSGGTTTVDVNKNGTTVFTTQANRPSVANTDGNNAIAVRTNMDVTSVAQNDRIEVDVDATETGSAQDVTVIIQVRYS